LKVFALCGARSPVNDVENVLSAIVIDRQPRRFGLGFRDGCHTTSIAHYLARNPWYSSPKELPLEDHTLLDGLRRIGFPES